MNVREEINTQTSSRPKLLALVAAIVLAGLVVYGVVERHENVSSLQTVADDEAVPKVQIVTPSQGPATHAVSLPGDIKAWYTAPIYAQVSGYVKKWYVDYGTFVKAGTLLATIDAPAVDQQYQAATANLAVAETSSKLAEVTAKRWKSLEGTEAVAQEDVDIKVASAEEKKARVEAAKDEVARYKAFEQFKSIVAPFDGIVTARDTDVGNYVNATGGDVSSHGSADELFSVADVHAMRIFVSVPQDYSDMLKPGLTATFTVPQYPGREFSAKLLTSANAFDPRTRTVVTELVADNADHQLWPGTYATVHFNVPTDKNVVVIPEQALLFREEGMQVAVVRDDGRVHLQNVKLGLNLGQTVQVTSGLNTTDRVIISPSAGILEGQKVDVVAGAPGTAPKSSVAALSRTANPESGNVENPQSDQKS
ncbi:efflux RND transporter periplasmic adaptor subunit [Paraburkholderia bannensis]|uniref:efflux RND transporter periplasmic adaptor subunit n=1 Tax=Paraburkholderia bannensis TaxID=765414 RepID=UPI002AB732C9|nr:efflux RND transporter periplasmic adaptor subunit [Paraburkholderia bannensis]